MRDTTHVMITPTSQPLFSSTLLQSCLGMRKTTIYSSLVLLLHALDSNAQVVWFWPIFQKDNIPTKLLTQLIKINVNHSTDIPVYMHASQRKICQRLFQMPSV